ncbi:MAG: hypothetical protein KAI38_06435 [Candidatus Latescibacteria bacterium]|nr:hypothetical protein [Candidatus Latescibacterota bacterium]
MQSAKVVLLGAITALLLCALPGIAFAQESSEASAAADKPAPDVSRLFKRFDEMYESSGTTAQVEITIVNPRKTTPSRSAICAATRRFWAGTPVRCRRRTGSPV